MKILIPLIAVLISGCAIAPVPVTPTVTTPPSAPKIATPLLASPKAAVLSATTSGSLSMTLQWPAGPAGVTRYRLYYGTGSRQYTKLVECGLATRTTVTGLKRGTVYYFANTQSAGPLESRFSPETRYSVAQKQSLPAISAPLAPNAIP